MWCSNILGIHTYCCLLTKHHTWIKEASSFFRNVDNFIILSTNITVRSIKLQICTTANIHRSLLRAGPCRYEDDRKFARNISNPLLLFWIFHECHKLNFLLQLQFRSFCLRAQPLTVGPLPKHCLSVWAQACTLKMRIQKGGTAVFLLWYL